MKPFSTDSTPKGPAGKQATLRREEYLGGDGSRIWRPTQSLEPFEVSLDFVLAVKVVVVIGAQIMERNTVFENMVDGNQHGMGNSDGGAVFSSASGNALVLCREISIFAIFCGFGALD